MHLGLLFDLYRTPRSIKTRFRKVTNLRVSHFFDRVVAVFGSSPMEVDSSVAAVCSALHVPYLTSHPVMASGSGGNLMSRKFAVHLGPSQSDLISAVKDTIDQLKWTQVALLSHRETGE